MVLCLARSCLVSQGSRTGRPSWREAVCLALRTAQKGCPLSATLHRSLTPPNTTATTTQPHRQHAHRHEHRHHHRHHARRRARTNAAGARLGAELRRRQHRRVLPPRADRVGPSGIHCCFKGRAGYIIRTGRHHQPVLPLHAEHVRQGHPAHVRDELLGWRNRLVERCLAQHAHTRRGAHQSLHSQSLRQRNMPSCTTIQQQQHCFRLCFLHCLRLCLLHCLCPCFLHCLRHREQQQHRHKRRRRRGQRASGARSGGLRRRSGTADARALGIRIGVRIDALSLVLGHGCSGTDALALRLWHWGLFICTASAETSYKFTARSLSSSRPRIQKASTGLALPAGSSAAACTPRASPRAAHSRDNANGQQRRRTRGRAESCPDP